MTTPSNQTLEENDTAYDERPRCECAHASPDGEGVECEDAAAFEVTLLYPERRCQEIYLLCPQCKADWVRNVPPAYRLVVRKLSRSGVPW